MANEKLLDVRGWLEHGGLPAAKCRGEVLAAFDQLVADAQRFKGLRMIVCESDKAKREKMLDAFEQRAAQFAERFGDVESVTPADVDEFVDLVLLAACEARK